MSLIIRAAQYAAQCHHGVRRKGCLTPYIVHPCRVAGRVATHEFATPELVAAAFLHDVVEDCKISLEEIDRRFGAIVAKYVEEVTNVKVPGFTREEQKAADRARLACVGQRAKVLKLIDRIENLTDLHFIDDEDFCKLYKEESLALAEVLADADRKLYAELVDIAHWGERTVRAKE